MRLVTWEPVTQTFPPLAALFYSFFFARRLSRCAQLTERLEEATFIGVLLLLTCMQARMANLYNLHCIYRLHNLNIELAMLENELQMRQHRRCRRYNPYRWHLPRPNRSWFEIHFRNRAIPTKYFKNQSSFLIAYKEHWTVAYGQEGSIFVAFSTRMAPNHKKKIDFTTFFNAYLRHEWTQGAHNLAE